MSARRYGQVPLSLWKRPAFKALSDDARLALLYFWCGPHSTSAGIGESPDLYTVADLGWTMERWTKARQEVETAGFIKRDATTETILVVDYLSNNRPKNVRHRAAIINQINSIECDALREIAEQSLADIDALSDQPFQSGAPSQRQSDLSPQMRAIMGGRK